MHAYNKYIAQPQWLRVHQLRYKAAGVGLHIKLYIPFQEVNMQLNIFAQKAQRSHMLTGHASRHEATAQEQLTMGESSEDLSFED